MRDAAALIAHLALAPHPEGGWDSETWRAAPVGATRGAGTSILLLLEAGQRSRWHRVDATEPWIFQAGTPPTLSLAAGGVVGSVRLGIDVLAGEQPQQVVAPGH